MTQSWRLVNLPVAARKDHFYRVPDQVAIFPRISPHLAPAGLLPIDRVSFRIYLEHFFDVCCVWSYSGVLWHRRWARAVSSVRTEGAI